jgi:hypothetical protein
MRFGVWLGTVGGRGVKSRFRGVVLYNQEVLDRRISKIDGVKIRVFWKSGRM